VSDSPSAISLLWPAATIAARNTKPWFDSTPADVGFSDLVRGLCLEPRYFDRVQGILMALCDDPGVIQYRQEIFDDLLASDALVSSLESALPTLTQLGYYGATSRPGDTLLQQTVFRLGELHLYVDGVTRLQSIFANITPQSRGLLALRDILVQLAADPSFINLQQELPTLSARIENIGSITLGINLDSRLRPVATTLLAVNPYKFKGDSLLARLFGKRTNTNTGEPDEQQNGLAELHTTPPDGPGHDNPLLVPLFRDLNEILQTAAGPVATALRQYTRLNGSMLIALEGEIAFYLGALRLIRKLHASGLPTCRPTILPKAAREMDVSGAYNINLALRFLGREVADSKSSLTERIVANEVRFDDTGRIFILTGPNQGGKTTYIQMVALVHVLAQAGVHVPAQSARLSPIDSLYTHFQRDEKPELEAGRLGEEARRLSDIFDRATRHSLVLLNESLSSTSPTESLYLAQDVVRALRLLGVRAIFATHLHALAEAADAINADVSAQSGAQSDGESGALSAVASLVSQVVPTQDTATPTRNRTFKIIRAAPMGLSYSKDIAERYGISFEQLQARLGKRDLMP